MLEKIYYIKPQHHDTICWGPCYLYKQINSGNVLVLLCVKESVLKQNKEQYFYHNWYSRYMFIERGDNLTHGQSLFSDTCITVVFIAFSSHTNIVVYPCHHLSIVLLSDLYVVLSFIISFSWLITDFFVKE